MQLLKLWLIKSRLFNYNVLSHYTTVVRKNEKAADFMCFLEKFENSILSASDTVKDVVLSYIKDISKVIPRYVKRQYEVDNFERRLVMESDLNSYNYLYYYGEKITTNHIKIVDFFNSKVDDSKLTDMAKFTLEAFLRGVKNCRQRDEEFVYVKGRG